MQCGLESSPSLHRRGLQFGCASVHSLNDPLQIAKYHTRVIDQEIHDASQHSHFNP